MHSQVDILGNHALQYSLYVALLPTLRNRADKIPTILLGRPIKKDEPAREQMEWVVEKIEPAVPIYISLAIFSKQCQAWIDCIRREAFQTSPELDPASDDHWPAVRQVYVQREPKVIGTVENMFRLCRPRSQRSNDVRIRVEIYPSILRDFAILYFPWRHLEDPGTTFSANSGGDLSFTNKKNEDNNAINNKHNGFRSKSNFIGITKHANFRVSAHTRHTSSLQNL